MAANFRHYNDYHQNYQTINVVDRDQESAYCDESSDNADVAVSKWKTGAKFFAMLLVVVTIAVIGTAASSHRSSGSSSASEIGTDVITTATDFTYNATLRRLTYDPPQVFQVGKPQFVQYKILENYSAIIEPGAQMILDISVPNIASHFSFTVCNATDEEASNDPCISGYIKYRSWDGVDETSDDLSPVSLSCQPYEKFAVTVNEFDSSTEALISSFVFQALCLYIRRDITSLTADDLSETMDAMYALWTYEEDEGQDKFGDSYHSALYFSEAHFFSAAQRDSDHIHEGLGFVPQHVKFCSKFERSMQAVNPRVSLPYWEFTQLAPMNTSIFESVMFSPDAFGSLTKPTDLMRGFTYELDNIEDGTIPDGRWANLKADMNTRMPTIPSSYGYIRSPWNVNPSPYITRYASSMPFLPACKDYEIALQFTDPVDFIDAVQKGPHASLHAVIGNVFGCDLLDQLWDQGLLRDEGAKTNLCRQWSYFMKDLYRDMYFTPRTDCSHDPRKPLNNYKCGYVCNPAMLKSMIPALQQLLSREYVPEEGLSTAQWETFRDFVCEGDGYRVVVGAHMDSTSASDPSFWPAHPTQERLVHAQLMSLGYDGTFDWNTDSENEYVCDANRCYSDSEGTKDYHAECCYGHNKDDQWLDFETADRYNFIGSTNIEIMLATNPVSADYSMPYIYDHFSYQHCAQSGHDVDAALISRYLGEADETSR
jgi:hypothetical protein